LLSVFFLYTRIEDAIGMLKLLMAPLALFAGVALVDTTFPEVGDSAHDSLVRFDVERATDIAETADRFRCVEFPRVVSEVAVGQCANWANRNAHPAVSARCFTEVDSVSRADAGFERAAGRFDRDDANHLVTDTRAAIAHDAAIPFVINGVAEMDIR